MQAGHVTPTTDPELTRLRVQHARDEAALERAADLLAARDRELLLRDRRIAQLERDQTTLILYSRRAV